MSMAQSILRGGSDIRHVCRDFSDEEREQVGSGSERSGSRSGER